MFKKFISKAKKMAKKVSSDQRGNVPALVWEVGLAVVAIFIILGLNGWAPGFTQGMFNGFAQWMKTTLGFTF